MTSSIGLPIVVIACKVFQNLLEKLMPEDMAEQITFLDYGLHSVPKKLNWTVQDAIKSIEKPSLVMLAYGICGNGLKDIKSGQHTLLIPRTDDCIAILLGSHKKYIEEFYATPGSYYLTKGWLESGSNPLAEYTELIGKYGEESAAWIMDQQYENYERLVFVAHNKQDLEKYRSQAQEVAEYCKRWGFRYEEISGSDIYIRRLIEVAMALDKKDDEFVIIPPGGKTTLDIFIR
ncbi:MAG: DUF1638 domain-containing protein [Anaerolineae bacterium]|jgi:hypothetical protein|nr:DUF1638 domain-containing protein [Anaerolineae bacterium]MBT3712017.1 DUF1638 domain-containing protein [Anaerolineae bacterium]MBT4308801.1 DUF1638 domain-containing protein [Anaerolineae bacterium]MBT4457087.1 DUF1638 domain-containing protein [Anaerolineae bacterium]MBT4843546.1 DUF1638 domain-containing protein [Anaerolineae bacterium]